MNARIKILYVADGRSPITTNWIKFFIDLGYEVHLASTYPCNPDLNLASLEMVPVAFNQAAGTPGRANGTSLPEASPRMGKYIRHLTTPGIRTRLRQWLGPLTITPAARRLRQYLDRVQPDLVHAMRIPYEGMLAAASHPSSPLIVSVWGNDFTLHAKATPWMAAHTRRTLKRADALHTDCHRDLRLAGHWGFSGGRPAVVLPTAGGVQLEIFFPLGTSKSDEETVGKDVDTPTVINPRGMRAYIRNDVFFRAIPLVLERSPMTKFLCPAMAGEHQAHDWVESLQISSAVTLFPHQSRRQIADLFRRSHVAVSPSQHDGTPNTLLESMACGCFPVAGDIESLREWITPGVNGLLVDPADPRALADAILLALERQDFRAEAARYNARLIAERAEYGAVMGKAGEFYRKVVQS